MPRGEPLRGHTGSVESVAFGELDGEPIVVSGGEDAVVRMWDAQTGMLRGEPLRGHTRPVESVVFGQLDGEPVVVSGSVDGTVRVWDARRGDRRFTLILGSRVADVQVGENGSIVVALPRGFACIDLSTPKSV
jgi:WD40 repeat protein